ncbi:MAG: hypothetical protein IPK26_12970 [Planctomycetes bacterium]|nr:hypothetical protein [Planctomycetota bacterium]
MSNLLTMGLQILLAIPPSAEPVRFGVAVPATAIANGLRLTGADGVMFQWRMLLPGVDRRGQVWIEVAATRGGGRLLAGGQAATAAGEGAAYVVRQERTAADGGADVVTTWQWADGTVDRLRQFEFSRPLQVGGEWFQAGEIRSVDEGGLAARASVVARLPRAFWTRVGLLPADGGIGGAARQRLLAVVPRLPELPGVRGAGDFSRSGGTITNLEYDTTLGLLRLALCTREPEVLVRARRSARHLVDRDLDRATGLPFAHGPDHRLGMPQTGHAWLTGLLWTGLLTADDRLIDAAKALAQVLAVTPPAGEGRNERARDWAWPLLELERYLQTFDDPLIAAAADRLAASIALRFDGSVPTFRFGEGEVDHVWFERGWITGGIVVPALRAHLARRPAPSLQAQVDAVAAALADRIGVGKPGLPTHWRVAGGRPFAEHRGERDPKSFLLLEALRPADLRRVLRREDVRAALVEVPEFEDPDLATSFSLLARCDWVCR